jgi:hypothetical protein
LYKAEIKAKTINITLIGIGIGTMKSNITETRNEERNIDFCKIYPPIRRGSSSNPDIV